MIRNERRKWRGGNDLSANSGVHSYAIPQSTVYQLITENDSFNTSYFSPQSTAWPHIQFQLNNPYLLVFTWSCLIIFTVFASKPTVYHFPNHLTTISSPHYLRPRNSSSIRAYLFPQRIDDHFTPNLAIHSSPCTSSHDTSSCLPSAKSSKQKHPWTTSQPYYSAQCTLIASSLNLQGTKKILPPNPSLRIPVFLKLAFPGSNPSRTFAIWPARRWFQSSAQPTGSWRIWAMQI